MTGNRDRTQDHPQTSADRPSPGGREAARPHWWHRVSADVKDWLANHHGEPLTTDVFDAVVGAGGMPRSREPAAMGLPDGPLLSEQDWEYCKEAGRAERER